MYKTTSIKVWLYRTEFFIPGSIIKRFRTSPLYFPQPKYCSHFNGLAFTNYSIKDIERPNLCQIFKKLKS